VRLEDSKGRELKLPGTDIAAQYFLPAGAIVSIQNGAEVGVGDLKMTVPNPHAYRAVAMSVHIGDVHAGAFGLEPSGFLGKSVEREFGAGQYRLKLHTGIGDVSCTADGV